jgi:tetratricopeptide (TPR) repeat protein
MIVPLNFDAALNNRTTAHAELGEYEQAISDLNRAIELTDEKKERRLAIRYFNRAYVYTLVGRDFEAQADADRAIALGSVPEVMERELEDAKLRR